MQLYLFFVTISERVSVAEVLSRVKNICFARVIKSFNLSQNKNNAIN